MGRGCRPARLAGKHRRSPDRVATPWHGQGCRASANAIPGSGLREARAARRWRRLGDSPDPARRGREDSMRSIIVDDEESARARLRRLLTAHPDIQVAGEARDGLEAVERIDELKPDLLFLDIELPGLTGFEVLQSIPAGVAMPLVIFATGYDQHALSAFEANALAYLLKPVEPERLAQAVERARKLSAVTRDGELERKHILQVARETPKTLRQIVCR